jgi:hypothetical protein
MKKVTSICSLQISEHFDASKLVIALEWEPFAQFIGLCIGDLYGAVIENVMPKTDKPASCE